MKKIFIDSFIALMIITLVATLTPAFSYAADENSEGESTEISPIVKLDAGAFNSAALLEDGSVYMWGDNEYYQTGKGDIQYCRTWENMSVLRQQQHISGSWQ